MPHLIEYHQQNPTAYDLLRAIHHEGKNTQVEILSKLKAKDKED